MTITIKNTLWRSHHGHGGSEELGRRESRRADTDRHDDVSCALRSTPDNRLHWKADADVALNGERHRQPDARVAARVSQLMTDAGRVCYVRAR